MSIEIIPEWMTNLDDEDMAFIKRLAINDKLDFETAKILVTEYKKIKRGE